MDGGQETQRSFFSELIEQSQTTCFGEEEVRETAGKIMDTIDGLNNNKKQEIIEEIDALIERQNNQDFIDLLKGMRMLTRRAISG